MDKTDYEWPDRVVPAATQGPIGRGERGRGEGEERVGGGKVCKPVVQV